MKRVNPLVIECYYITNLECKKMNLRNLMFFMALFLWTCNPGETGTDNSSAAKSFALNGADKVKILNPSGPFLTSPNWLLDGSGIVARGRGGRGLYILRPEGQNLEIVDSLAYGFIYWIREGDTFCMLSAGTWRLFDYDPETSQLDFAIEQSGPCVPSDDPFSTVRALDAGPNTQVLFDIYRGSLTVDSVEVEPSAAWGVSVAPDGSAVAYVTGHFRNPSLFIFEKELGRFRIASGVHPVWLPDSMTLVYAVPLVNDVGTVAASELFSFNLETRTTLKLTQTDSIVEMQPTVSPDGSLIAFSDWRSGAIMLLSAGKEVGP